MYIVWLLVHTFGWAFWLTGLLGSTFAAVAARKIPEPEGRGGAWAAGQRMWWMEIFGMVTVPVSGLMLGSILATGFGKMFTDPNLRFIHYKLTFVLVALVCNVLLFGLRKKIASQIVSDDPDVHQSFKRLSMLQGIATLMLPLSILAVLLLGNKHGG